MINRSFITNQKQEKIWGRVKDVKSEVIGLEMNLNGPMGQPQTPILKSIK